jgi:sulfatase maturation enzyme AslB (radical SAM superfamily)
MSTEIARVPNPKYDVTFFPFKKFQLLFTEKCNLNCTYCFEKDKMNRDMKIEDLGKVIDDLSNLSFYMFGGEPFLNLDLVEQLIEGFKKKGMDDAQRRQIIESLAFHTTNGTLLEKHLETIKKYDLSLQISLDGPKDINDANRVYHNGRGSFDDVMRNIEKLNGVTSKWTLHGAVSQSQIPNLFDIFKFHFDVYAKYRGLDTAIRSMQNNVFQVIFEQDYTDQDVDIFLQQSAKTAEWSMSTEEYPMTLEQRVNFFLSYFVFRRGSSCIAGNSMVSMDLNYNVYPCHRLAILPNRHEYSLGNLRGPRRFKNFKVFNTFIKLDREQSMYSAYQSVKEWQGYLSWQNWCPSANAENGGSPFYQNSKHNALIAEFGMFVQELAAAYDIDIPAPEPQLFQTFLKRAPTMRANTCEDCDGDCDCGD